MSKQETKHKTPASRIRLAIIDDASHMELSSFRTTRSNAIMLLVLAVFLIIAITYSILAFTFMRHTIPGYPSSHTKELAMANAAKIDSLERVIDTWALQMSNIQRIATGLEPLTIDSTASVRQSTQSSDKEMEIMAKSDSIIRDEVRQSELFNISAEKKNKASQIESLHFYPPVKGIITEGYNKLINHPYIDIAAPANTSICAVLDGTVIYAGWNDKTGYTIHLQHDDNIVSVYKHNEKLLKKTGDKVTAGTPIAIIGNTGELSTGTHLHFELWHKGEAVDPSLYISF